MPKRRRRSFTAEFMAQVVLEVLSGLKSQAEVARLHKLKPNSSPAGRTSPLLGQRPGQELPAAPLPRTTTSYSSGCNIVPPLEMRFAWVPDAAVDRCS
jgi:hypothetical protein